MIRLASIFAIFAFLFSTPSPAETLGNERQPVLVELFTSQGCANCPKANRFLAELADDPDIITLSLAVDYWDYLGWKDTFAMSDFAQRQTSYVNTLHARRPFTPQLIIDGQASAKGTRTGKVRNLIQQHKTTELAGPKISLSMDGDYLRLDIAAGLAPKDGAMILIADFMPGVQKVMVTGGENKGKTLDQVNMVTRLRPLGRWTGEAMQLRFPAMEQGSCVAILQEVGPGRVLAVTRLQS